MRYLLAAVLCCVSGAIDGFACAQQKLPEPVVIVPATATSPPAPKTPKCDESCVRSNAEKASASCARKIEAQAPGDFEWITRPFTGIFQQADPSKGEEPIATYRGDSIRFMSPQKDWVRVTYECVFNVERSVATIVRVRPGRLDRPLAEQPASASAQASHQPPLASAPLAAAILNAAKQRSGAQPGKPLSPPKIGEPSAVGVSQIDSNRGTW
jgi:hypothetical protein